MVIGNGLSRRQCLAAAVAARASLIPGGPAHAQGTEPASPAIQDKALIAITFDLEMARNFPTWDQTHWDYEKGNLNEAAKQYAIAAARRVKENGGRMHFFALGQTLEQESVDWLKSIVEAGHPVGNHTYDHVYVLAREPKEIQFRFARAPWLIEGRTPAVVIRDNIRLCTAAMKTRLGIDPAGFRTPGGFADGLNGRPDVQQMLLELGFEWISCRYPPYPPPEQGKRPSKRDYDALLEAQELAQPFTYPTGLVDVPMSPISDIGAFRNGRWQLPWFLEAIRLAITWTIANGAVFDFLAHPSVLGVVDPEFRAIDLICKLVREAGNRAAIVDLGAFARRA